MQTIICGMDKQQALLCTTGSNNQYPLINLKGNEYEKECIYIITESLCCTADINTTL